MAPAQAKSDPITRRDPAAVKAVIAALAAKFGNRLVTSQAVREQHANTTTWIANEPPDAVVFAQATQDVQDVVRICAAHRVPVIPFGTGTSLEGQINAPVGGVSIDFRDMNRVLAVNSQDLDCVVEPGITRKQLNEHLRDQGLFFPLDPGADASLGGMAATRCSGTNAVRYGTMKDNVLALKVVLANGGLMTTARLAKKSAARSNGRPSPRTARACGRRVTTPIGRGGGCAPARRRSPPMSACRSRGWRNASPQPSVRSLRLASWRRSSVMWATEISISPCW